jgi:hypothetical protein
MHVSLYMRGSVCAIVLRLKDSMHDILARMVIGGMYCCCFFV